MDQNPKIGSRVMLVLRTNEIFIGTIEDVNQSSFDISNCQLSDNDSVIPGNLTFYKNEITSIRVLKSQNRDSTESCSTSNVSNGLTIVSMSEGEFSRLKEMARKSIYVTVFDAEFQKAVEDLKNCESVGVMGLGCFQKAKPLTVLLMSTFKQIYIFDMQSLQEMRGLKEIFEADYITKVVHDQTALFHCLYHKYDIEMINIYDTQVADQWLSEKNGQPIQSRNISECLTQHFNFPSTFLQTSLDNSDDPHWQQRPLTRNHRVLLAHLVAFLLNLRDCLVKSMLKDFWDKVDSKYEKLIHVNEFDIAKGVANWKL